MSALLLAAALAIGSAAPSPAGLDACDAWVAREPESFDAYRCYWTVARRDNLFRDAIARLDARLRSSPENHRAELYLGLLLLDQREERGAPLLRSAADGFEREGNDRGVVYSRISLLPLLRARGRSDEALNDLDAAERAAERSGDPELTTLVGIERGWEALREGDKGQAYAIFRRLSYETSEGEVPEYLYPKTLSGLGASAWAVSRFEDALSAYLRQANLLRLRHQPFEESTARANVALLSRYCGLEREQILRYAEEALAVGEAAGNPRLLSPMEVILGWASTSRAEKISHYRTALTLARSSDDIGSQVVAADKLGLFLAEEPGKLDEALALIAWADRLARGAGDTERELSAAAARWNALWNAGEFDRAFTAADDVLDRIDRIVERERGRPNRARVFSRHSAVHRAVAGRLLDARSGLGEDGIARAFDVLERMRSRELLFALEAEPRRDARDDAPTDAALLRVLARIAEIQRSLVDRTLPAEDRERAVAELDTLEAEEAARADRVLGPATTRRVDVAALQARLGEDQMLLAYSLLPMDEYDPGSWVVAIGRSSVRAYRLPTLHDIAAGVDVFLSLVKRGDGSEAAAGARLYEELLLPALRGATTPVKHLVVLPDDVLYDLPFELLRPSTSGSEADLAITIAPSATIWARLEEGQRQEGSKALALADPSLPAPSGRAALSRDWRALGATELGALPFARDEAHDVSLAFPNVVVREGAAASETFLKTTDLSPYALIHVAAHALVDTGRPERSALLFQPGSPAEDGLLQPREISSLDLRGRVVVLSACRSASGEILGGEGPLGLAQAMFQAGARAVVGSLWPLEDEDAEKFVHEFYVALGKGESLATALAQARRARQKAGSPAIAWAGFVVIGDGDFVPVPGGRHEAGTSLGAPLAVLLGLLTLVAWLRWGRF